MKSMKFDQLDKTEKSVYFAEIHQNHGSAADLLRSWGLSKFVSAFQNSKYSDDVEEYVLRNHPDVYKKIVQAGNKQMENSTLGAIPKGYKNVRKADIIAAVAKKTGTTKKAATEVVNAYWATIKETLEKKSDANITIPNVGSIRCFLKPARK